MERSNTPQKRGQFINLRKVFLIFVTIVFFTIFYFQLANYGFKVKEASNDILGKMEVHNKSIIQKYTFLGVNSTFEDKEWKEQAIKYNFSCIHGQMTKNYEPFTINKPGGDVIYQKQYQKNQSNHEGNVQKNKYSNEGNLQRSIKENIFNVLKKGNKQEIHDFKERKHKIIEQDDNSQQQLDSSIKISLDYSNFQMSQANKDKLNYIQQTLIPQMINTIRQIVSVQRSTQSSIERIKQVAKQQGKSTHLYDKKISQEESQIFNQQNYSNEQRNQFNKEVENEQIESSNKQQSVQHQNKYSDIKKQIRHQTNLQQKNKIYVPYGQCFRTKVPQQHSTVGVDSDIILYITNLKESQSGSNLPQLKSSLIWGVVCVRDFQDNYRPVAAQLNINDDLLDHINNHSFNSNALLHEMLHILGFSKQSLELSTKSKNIIKKSPYDQTKSIIALESLRNYAQTYYNCTNDKLFQGIEIEDEEDDIDQLSLHFEKRYLMNDIMTADISINSMISPLTLKVLESTGWYKIKYDLSMQYQYLLLSGCSILSNFTQYYQNQTNLQNSQIEPQVTQKNHSQTNTNSSQNGTDKQNDGGYHNLRKRIYHKVNYNQNTTIPQELTSLQLNTYDNNVQNLCNQTTFNQEIRGCSYDFKYKSACYNSIYSNHYSYLQPLERGSCIDDQNNQHLSVQNITGEVFSQQSFCFISNLVQNTTIPNVTIDSTRCYAAKCNDYLKEITISLFNNTVTCKKDNEIILNPFGLKGQLNCPNISKFCISYDLRNYNPSNQNI